MQKSRCRCTLLVCGTAKAGRSAFVRCDSSCPLPRRWRRAPAIALRRLLSAVVVLIAAKALLAVQQLLLQHVRRIMTPPSSSSFALCAGSSFLPCAYASGLSLVVARPFFLLCLATVCGVWVRLRCLAARRLCRFGCISKSYVADFSNWDKDFNKPWGDPLLLRSTA